MTLKKSSLEAAAAKGLLEPHQVEPLYAFLHTQPDNVPRLDMTHLLYYFGGLLAIGALSLFMNLGWEQFGGWGILTLCLIYTVLALSLARYLARTGRDIPAGIAAAFVIALTPLAIYGLQQGMGWWPDDRNYRDYHRYIQLLWIYMELGTLLVGALLLRHYRYPFLLMPIAATLWYLSMDITQLFAGANANFTERALISMWFGVAMTLLAVWVDIRARKTLDYAFWLYLFGVLTFWGGLSAQHSDSEWSKFIYFLINLGLIGIGVILQRKVFVIVGALGSCGYCGHLAHQIFRDSWLFPIALTVIGAAVIYLGILWQKNEAAITQKVHRQLPPALRELLQHREN